MPSAAGRAMGATATLRQGQASGLCLPWAWLGSPGGDRESQLLRQAFDRQGQPVGPVRALNGPGRGGYRTSIVPAGDDFAVLWAERDGNTYFARAALDCD